MDDWTTRVPPAFTRPHGVEEVHNVNFEPRNWPGHGPCISLLVPECEVQFCKLMADGQPFVIVNRPPPPTRNVKRWLRYVCERATQHQLFVSFGCDTAAQAEQVAKLAARLLPNHQRAALERMYDPATRAKGKLS